MKSSSDGPPTLPTGVEAIRTPSGLEYLDFAGGEGPAVAPGSRVTVEYRAWLTDGTLFDRTSPDTGPVAFQVGRGQVIPALEEGVVGMRVGGGRRLIVPSDLAYGARGRAAVPPFATLIYDVLVVAIR
jgi:peptidylprolyl isomerase